MKPTPKLLLLAFLASPLISSADTNRECLNHLGGAFADVECYNGLSNDLIVENKTLMEKIMESIPTKNRNRALFRKYEISQTQSLKFCEINRAALIGWGQKNHSVKPRYYAYDVAYYQCIHRRLEEQNLFLNDVVKNIQISE